MKPNKLLTIFVTAISLFFSAPSFSRRELTQKEMDYIKNMPPPTPEELEFAKNMENLVEELRRSDPKFVEQLEQLGQAMIDQMGPDMFMPPPNTDYQRSSGPYQPAKKPQQTESKRRHETKKQDVGLKNKAEDKKLLLAIVADITSVQQKSTQDEKVAGILTPVLKPLEELSKSAKTLAEERLLGKLTEKEFAPVRTTLVEVAKHLSNNNKRIVVEQSVAKTADAAEELAEEARKVKAEGAATDLVNALTKQPAETKEGTPGLLADAVSKTKKLIEKYKVEKPVELDLGPVLDMPITTQSYQPPSRPEPIVKNNDNQLLAAKLETIEELLDSTEGDILANSEAFNKLLDPGYLYPATTDPNHKSVQHKLNNPVIMVEAQLKSVGKELDRFDRQMKKADVSTSDKEKLTAQLSRAKTKFSNNTKAFREKLENYSSEKVLDSAKKEAHDEQIMSLKKQIKGIFRVARTG